MTYLSYRMQEVHRCTVVYLFFEWNNYIVIQGYPGHGMEQVNSYTGVSLVTYKGHGTEQVHSYT